MPKRAHIVLCDRDGVILGECDPIDCAMPWWQEVSDVVAAVRDRDGIDITVLRLIDGQLPLPSSPGDRSSVTYLAEVEDGLAGQSLRRTQQQPLRPTTWRAVSHPLRMRYAEPGGPAALLDWAQAELAAAGRHVTGRPEQMRTWNLSEAIWRIPTASDPVWLKAVPPFFAHEPAMLALLGSGALPGPAALSGSGALPGPGALSGSGASPRSGASSGSGALPGLAALSGSRRVPELIAGEPGRCLLAHVHGRPVVDADTRARLALVDVVAGLHRAWVSRTAELLRAGCFDLRASILVERMSSLPVLADPGDRVAVEALVASLPERFAELETCGIPETLVHGDAYLQNALVDERGEITLLDWGDAGVGHPFLDVGALERWRDAAEIEQLHARLVELWSDVASPAQVRRAIELCRPLGALRAAEVYAHFLAHIEPSEYPYHQGDSAVALREAVRLAAVA